MTSLLQNTIPYFENVYRAFLIYTSLFCSYLPILTYIIVYGIIAGFLKEILIDFLKNMSVSSDDLKSCHRIYSNLKRLVEYVGTKLTHINCFATFLIASQFYFTMFSKIQIIFPFKAVRTTGIMLIVVIVIHVIKSINEAGEILIVN